ncbi:MAG: hypothetical protein HC767_02980 [Akkermansiaceae bacterium]|nr:hypothetical protein [Akkermansiaceae bacterium]
MELEDGTKMIQSIAIAFHCADQVGMLPSDPYKVARTIELVNTIEDVRLHCTV